MSAQGSYSEMKEPLWVAMRACREGRYILAGRQIERAYQVLYDGANPAYRTPIWHFHRDLFQSVLMALIVAEGSKP